MLCKSSHIQERDWPITDVLIDVTLLWVKDNSSKCCKGRGSDIQLCIEVNKYQLNETKLFKQN